MADFFQIVVAFIPFGSIVVALLMSLLLCFTAALVWPRYVMLFFLGVFVLFPNEGGWAMEDASRAFNVYSKGQRAFVFPALMVYLWGLWLSVQLRFAVSRERGISSPLKWWFAGLAVLVLLHAAFAPMFDESVLLALSPSGLINLVNMGMAFSLMLHLFVSSRDVEALERWFLILFTARMIWGLARFVALGGDPMNVYESKQGIGVRITFFDINDNLLACVALALAAWRFAGVRTQRWGTTHWLYIFVVVLALFTVFFSFRRTAWVGLILAVAVIMTSRHWPYRFATFAAGSLLGLPAIAYVALKRFSEPGYSGKGFMAMLFPDLGSGGTLSLETGRFSEMTAMVRSVGDNWLWGLGTWGEFDGRFYRDIAFHHGFFGYVHSGFGHVYLKAGVIGLVLFAALFISYLVFIVRHRYRVDSRFRPLFECSLVAMAFALPNLLGGSPVIELRTMVLLAIFMALPFIVIGIQAKESAASP